MPEAAQRNLFRPPTQAIVPVELKGLRIEEQAQRFHEANPHVYDAVVSVALGMKAAGFKKGAIKMIWERLRWLHAMRTGGGDYKLNNNFAPWYARLVMDTVPELHGFFETRALRYERNA